MQMRAPEVLSIAKTVEGGCGLFELHSMGGVACSIAIQALDCAALVAAVGLEPTTLRHRDSLLSRRRKAETVLFPVAPLQTATVLLRPELLQRSLPTARRASRPRRLSSDCRFGGGGWTRTNDL